MKNIKKYAIIAIFSVVLIIPSVSSAQTVADLQAQISALLAQINNLQQQLAQLQGQPATWCHDFNVNLKVGDQGDEIEALHTALEKEGFNVFAAGPEVSVSEVRYFSEKTASAVSGFQQKYKDEILAPWGLQYGTGFVGSTTRAKLNSLYGCGVVPKPTGVVPKPTCGVFVTCVEGTTQTYVGTDEKGCPQYECRPAPVACGELVCQIGYTLYDTGQKASNGCLIKKCIPITGNQPPVISGISGPTTLNVGQTGTWTVKASDPEQGVLTYQVFWGDEATGTSAQLSQPLTYYSQTATFTHSYSKAGIYNPTFIVADNQGLSAKTSISVNVGEVTGPFFSITVNPPVPQTTDGIYSLTSGSVYTFTGTVKNAQAYQPAYLSLRRPDGSLKYDRYFIGQTDSTGYLSQSTTQTIIGGQTGTYIAWINVGTWTSGTVKFNIYPAPTPSITVLSPNGGEKWQAGQSYLINFQTTNVPSGATIYLYLERPEAVTSRLVVVQSIVGLSASSTSYSWQIPTTLTLAGDYKILASISSGEQVVASDTSDAPFSIVAAPSITVLSPNGGDVWEIGKFYTILWSSVNVPTVMVDLIRPRYECHLTSGDVINGGSIAYNIGNCANGILIPPASDYKIRVMYRSNAGIITQDESNATFSIVASPYNCRRCSTYYKYAWADFTADSDADCAAGAGAVPGTTVLYNKNCSCTTGTNTYNANWNNECTGTVPLSCSPGQLIGDIDNDGKVTKNDADLVGKMGVGTISKPSNTCCVDLNQDGKVDIVDALKIARIAEGLDSSPGSCVVSSGVGQSSQLNQMASALESMKNLLYLLLQAIGH